MAKLYFYYSAMNAGKTTTLLQSNYNYQNYMRTLVLKPKLDDRFGEGIRSRIGLHAEAHDFGGDDLFAIATARRTLTAQTALVDEAQFMTRAQVEQLTEIVDTLAIGTDLRSAHRFQGELFEGSTPARDELKNQNHLSLWP